MHARFIAHAHGLVAMVCLASCGETAQFTVQAGSGPRPVLPAPSLSALPTVNVAAAVGWPTGVMPAPSEGLAVNAFAVDLDHPRWLHVLPNGDVLVAESNAPAKPDDAQGLRGWVMGLFMKRAGAVTASADRITLLRDADGDGVAEQRFVLLDKLHSPLGMALVGQRLFVANTDAVWSFPYRTADMHISAAGEQLIGLPAGRINHHWTKSLIASLDGQRLYVTVGSNSNVAERGMAAEEGRAAIWEVDIATRTHRLFATGLRNPNGMAWDAQSQALWAVVNERDELGSDLVPDYLTSVKDGAFFGWPYSYFGPTVDARVKPPRPDLVAKAQVPDYALGPHTASLGLADAEGNRLPSRFAQGMFISQHGSWNRRPHSGYRVVFVPFAGGRPTGELPLDVLSGFLNAASQAYGRPVGVAVDRQGAVLVADDVGNIIWRVVAQAQQEPMGQTPAQSRKP